MRAVGKALAKTLIESVRHSVGSKKEAVSARTEILKICKNLLDWRWPKIVSGNIRVRQQ